MLPEGLTVLRPLISALVTTLFVALLGAGGGVGIATSASAAPRESAIELGTELTLLVPRCEACVITVFSSDGVGPVYASFPATVLDGSVTITLPSARTAGMSVQVDAPWASSRSYETFVAWRYSGTEIGDSVSFKDARAKKRASGCWSGTVNAAVTLRIKVRRVSFLGQPAAIAWTPVTESFVKPMKRIRSGVLTSDDALACDLDS